MSALARAANLNVIYGDMPAKKTSLHLNNSVNASEIPDILHHVATTNGLKITEDNGIISIGSATQGGAGQQRKMTFDGTELHVYQLRHANATRLSQILQAMFATGTNGGLTRFNPSNGQGQNQGGLQGGRNGRNSGAGGGGFGGRTGRNGGGGGNAGGFGTQNGGNGGGGNPLQGIGQVVINGGQGNGDTPQIVIVPDETTNSLLVRAAPNDWEVIQEAIAAVDIRPRQVIIEVMIAEVTRNDDLTLGVTGSGTNHPKTQNGTATSGSLSSLIDTTASFIARFMNKGSVDLNVALTALQTRGTVRVLSLPLVLAQNNNESVLFVGSQYPFIESSRLLATSSDAIDQTVSYKNIGTTLDILPTINPDGYVNLVVYQEVSAASSILTNASTHIDAPVFTNRNAEASVFVKSGQTVVVGGLTDRSETRVRSGIPVLSQIPVLGGLFGSTTKLTTRTELYLFLTPHVVMNDADAEHAREQVTKHSELMHAIPLDSVRVIDPQTQFLTPSPAVEPSTPKPAPSMPSRNPSVNMPALPSSGAPATPQTRP
jgi:general secretion pathway protein D